MEDPGALGYFSLVSFGLDLEADFSLPTRGNGLVKVGHRTTSTGLDAFYQESLITLVQNLEGMLNDLTFHHLAKVKTLFFQDHFWPVSILGYGGTAPKQGNKE